jgi:hypothetical protein
MRNIAFLLSLVVVMSMAVLAAEPPAVRVEQPWARPTPPTVTNGAAYLTLVNQGKQADRLLGVTGDVARTIELHIHVEEGGVMKMRPVEAIEVKPGESVVLKPGGLHIMLVELKQPLVEGQRFKLLLNFEQAGKIPVDVHVTSMEPEPMHPSGDSHKP